MPAKHGRKQQAEQANRYKRQGNDDPEQSILKNSELRRCINACSASAKPIQWKYSNPARRIRSDFVSATRR